MADSRLSRFSSAIDAIYEASLRPSAWPEAVACISGLLDAPFANLVTPTTPLDTGGFAFPFGVEERFLRLYATKYQEQDVWAIGAAKRGLVQSGRVYLGAEVIGFDELERTEFYRDFLEKIGIWDSCIGVVFDGLSSSEPMTACSLFRSRREPRFTEESRHVHRLVVSHVSRSLGTMFRLRGTELALASTFAALDAVQSGIVLFGERGNVLHVNQTALSILERHDGLSLRAGNPLSDEVGWLSASHASDDKAVRCAIASALAAKAGNVDHFSRGVSIRRPSGARGYVFQVSTLPPANEFSAGHRVARAIGFLNDPEVIRQPSEQLLRSTYGLTHSEIQLAGILVKGTGLVEAARVLHVSQNTAKTQLQSIFQKTNTSRQAQLVRLLLSLAG